jgi:hypothetical protein
MVRKMGAQDPSIRMPCLDYHVPNLYRVGSFNVFGDWSCYDRIQVWEVDEEEVESKIERLVEILEVLSAGMVERVEVETG